MFTHGCGKPPSPTVRQHAVSLAECSKHWRDFSGPHQELSAKYSKKSSGLVRLLQLLRPLVELCFVFVWVVYLVGLLRTQDYNGSLAFDLFLARVGGPTASHVTTYLIFLSIFPIAYLMLKSIIPAFLIEVLAFDIHEGLWQIPYFIAWHSTIDWRVWLVENLPDTVTAFAAIAVLVMVYHLPARFFVAVTIAWGCFLSAWLAIGFPVSVLSKLPNYQIVPSVYNTTLWVNQIEFLGWLYFAFVLLICLRYFTARVHYETRNPALR